MKNVSVILCCAILSLCSGATATQAANTNPLFMKLGTKQAFQGDQVKVVHKIADKTKFGITLTNDSTKMQTFLRAENFVWTGGNGENLSIKIPSDLAAGNYTVNLEESGAIVGVAALTIKAYATVSSSDLEGVLPGQPVTIYGTGFSTTLTDNVVEFNTQTGRDDSLGGQRYYGGPTGTYKVTPTSATATSLTVVAPQEVADYATSQVSVPTIVTVKVGGIQARGEVKVFLAIRQWARGETPIIIQH